MTDATPRPVVVGIDGSEGSCLALAWAVEEVTRQRLPLMALCAWQSDDAPETVAPLVSTIEERCRSILETATADVRKLSPGIDLRTRVVHAQPASALIASSRHAHTVVVGSRGLGAVKEALVGSTSMQLAAYASCPVVVVREVAARHGANRRVVVGVDGSDLSTEATGYAFEQASQRGLGLTVLHAWDANFYASSVALSALAETWNDLEVEQEVVTSAAIAGWADEVPGRRCADPRDPGPSRRHPRRRLRRQRARRGRQPRTRRLPRPAPRIRQPQRPAPRTLPGRRHPTLLAPRPRRARVGPHTHTGPPARTTRQEADMSSALTTPTRRGRRRRFSDQRPGTALGHPRGLDPSNTPPPGQRLEPQLRPRHPRAGHPNGGGPLSGHPGRRPERGHRRRPRGRGDEHAYVGPATTSLVEASLHADTVVVGSRGRRALPGFLLGATSLEVAAHAACPASSSSATTRCRSATLERVVVGVDGSPRSSDAVAYAFAFASAHDLDLTVLHAFQVEYVAGVISTLSAEQSNARLAQEELALTSETVAGWQEKYPDVHVETATLRAHPVDALVDASKISDLLVIGGRRRGRIGGALLGAVGHGVLHDAHCPVAVVRAQPTSGAQHR